jgi:hypothetical protein
MAPMSMKLEGKVSEPALRAMVNCLQHLQQAGAKLGQLVQKEHAPVGQRDLARAGYPAAAHQPRKADRVMRRTEGPVADEGRIARQLAGHAIDLGHRQ